MPNEEYQRLLRADARELRERLEVDADDLDDAELLATFRDLGGHDLGALIDGYRQADAVRDRPSVVFAYTIKGWRLPTEGHPANHSALLNDEQYARAGGRARRRPGRPVGGASTTGIAGGRAVRARGAAAASAAAARASPRRRRCPTTSAASTRGTRVDPAGVRALLRRPRARGARGRRARRHGLARRRHLDQPRRLDQQGGHLVASATGSTGSPTTPTRSCAGARPTTAATSSSGSPRSTSSALLGELGATWSRDGQPLLPVGTIYDPFVARALEPWSFGIYAGGQSILVGTPSGVTLGPEGGAHQSVITPSIGIEQPGCVAWEPAFGQDFEWAFLHALSRLGRAGRRGRLLPPLDAPDRPVAAHRHARGGAARAATGCAAPTTPRVVIAVMGALVPEAVEAADMLREEADVEAEVVCITSADLLFRSFQARAGLGDGDPADRSTGCSRTAPRSSRCSTATRTRSRSCGVADRLPRRAALRPVGRHRRALRAPRRSTPSRSSAPRLM